MLTSRMYEPYVSKHRDKVKRTGSTADRIALGALLVALVALAFSAYQAHVAAESLNAQAGTLRLHDRPWLAVSGFGAPALDGSSTDKAGWEITNVGPVPTQRATYLDYWMVRNPPDVDAPNSTAPPPPEQSEFPSGQAVRLIEKLGEPRPIPAGLVALVKAGTATLFLCIEVHYEDLQSVTHTLRSCEKYDRRDNSWSIAPPKLHPGEVL